MVRVNATQHIPSIQLFQKCLGASNVANSKATRVERRGGISLPCSSLISEHRPNPYTWAFKSEEVFLPAYLFIIFATIFRFVAIQGRSQFLVNIYVMQHHGAQILLEAPRCCCDTHSCFYLLRDVTA